MKSVNVLIVMFSLFLPQFSQNKSNDEMRRRALFENLPGKAIISISPTSVEKGFITIRIAKVSKENPENEFFLVNPNSLQLDTDYNLYTIDTNQNCIIGFSKELKGFKRIGRKGEGPGEFQLFSNGLAYLNIFNNVIYASDPAINTVHLFALPDGKALRDIKFERKNVNGLPVIDEKGNLFMHDSSAGVIFSQISPLGATERSFMKDKWHKDLRISLVKELHGAARAHYVRSTPQTVFFDTIGDNKFFVFFYFSAKYFILENERVVKSGFLWPKAAIERHIKRLKTISDPDATLYLFSNVFRDVEKRDGYYFQHLAWENSQNCKVHLYHFDTLGKLVRAFSTPPLEPRSVIKFYLKKNRDFYGVLNRDGEKSLVIFKEEG